ncbi:ATP-binding protein [Alteromonas sp. ASW11-36]|uniref:histidine kinase n=1 Tax=Alteromonas arenosi TaxID=3055817 RepID=A0ABT7SSB8_9ALTE|nr:ATP-binding protein [Alteromonas sp. ASW11-36]MDM7859040.1 ATP-binding protein [Alteromonas sp. ASW11-36]
MRFGIAQKLIIPTTLVFIVLSLLVTNTLLNLYREEQLDTTKRHAIDLASQAAMQFDFSLGDDSLKKVVTGIALSDHILQVAVVDPSNDNVIASSFYRYAEQSVVDLPEIMQSVYFANRNSVVPVFTDVIDKQYAMAYPVTVLAANNTDTRPLILIMYFDTLVLDRQYAEYQWRFSIVAILFVSLLLALLYILVRQVIRRPLARFENSIHTQTETGHLGEVELDTGDELQDIADTFNRFVRAEQATFKAQQQALVATEQLAAKKTQFLANMSHELRTPLNGITGLAQLCKDETDEEKRQKYLSQLLKSSGLLISLVNDILDFSRMNDAELTLSPTCGALREVISEIYDLTKVVADQKGVLLEYQIATTCSTGYLLDQKRLKQVLLNLLNNAIKFTEQGKVTLTVDFQQGQLVFLVQDTGIGISKRDIQRLFDPFEQADSSISRKYGGTGLGLSICQKIVESMQGKITVSSTLGQGSKFKVSIPAEACIPLNDPPSAPHVTDGANKGLKILVAEDNDINALIIQDMLASMGHKVVVVDNGEKAVVACREKRFDVVLMDIQMPIMDGLKATQNIRDLGDTTPIVGLSANVFKEDEDAALTAGMNDYLHKPVVKATLEKCLSQFSAQ